MKEWKLDEKGIKGRDGLDASSFICQSCDINTFISIKNLYYFKVLVDVFASVQVSTEARRESDTLDLE